MYLTIQLEPISFEIFTCNSYGNFVYTLNKIELSALNTKMSFFKNIVESPCVAIVICAKI